MESIKINNFEINKGRTFIIAELSANHNHNFDVAVKTIHKAKECGADAIKIQTYTADTITLDVKNENFKINRGTIWDGQYLYDLYKQAYTPWDWQPKLKKIAEDIGLIFFSSPFDFTAVDFLQEMDVPAYKIASYEINDIPLIVYAAKKGKPIIISTGVAHEDEINDAVQACHKVGNKQVILLKCTSAYPAPPDEMNLNTIPLMKEKFHCPVGLSDHTMSPTAAIASVALGACVIEKHFILDRSIGGPDASFSLEPKDFNSMVNAIRELEMELGKRTFAKSEKIEKERENMRSLFVVKDIKKGDTLTAENIRSIRPAFGLSPKHFNDIIGKKASKDIQKGTPLMWNLLSE